MKKTVPRRRAKQKCAQCWQSGRAVLRTECRIHRKGTIPTNRVGSSVGQVDSAHAAPPLLHQTHPRWLSATYLPHAAGLLASHLCCYLCSIQNHLSPVQLHSYSAVLVFCCTRILLYSYSAVLAFSCTRILLHSYSAVLVFCCTRILLYSYSVALVFSCTRILLHSYSTVLTFSCTRIQLRSYSVLVFCARILLYSYSAALVFCCTRILLYSYSAVLVFCSDCCAAECEYCSAAALFLLPLLCSAIRAALECE